MKLKLLLYCNKARPILRKLDKYFLGSHTDNYYWKKGQTVPYNVNGKIVAECDFEVSIHNWYNDYSLFEKLYYQENMIFNNENSCMSSRELVSYLGNNNLKKDFYAIHIKNLHIFDEPKELREYGTWVQPLFLNEGELALKKLEKAPQNMMKCYDFEKDYILISIQPQWLCKILNGEKTIEVRKKVLKEML